MSFKTISTEHSLTFLVGDKMAYYTRSDQTMEMLTSYLIDRLAKHCKYKSYTRSIKKTRTCGTGLFAKETNLTSNAALDSCQDPT